VARRGPGRRFGARPFVGNWGGWSTPPAAAPLAARSLTVSSSLGMLPGHSPHCPYDWPCRPRSRIGFLLPSPRASPGLRPAQPGASPADLSAARRRPVLRQQGFRRDNPCPLYVQPGQFGGRHDPGAPGPGHHHMVSRNQDRICPTTPQWVTMPKREAEGSWAVKRRWTDRTPTGPVVRPRGRASRNLGPRTQLGRNTQSTRTRKICSPQRALMAATNGTYPAVGLPNGARERSLPLDQG